MLEDLNRDLKGFVELYQDGQVLEIRMVKPEVNAICRRMSRSIEHAALYLQHEPGLRVGILSSGSNRAFSAGLDFREATSPISEVQESGANDGGFGGITTLWSLKKPLIAAINAPAVGGGVELALACDILLMADEAFLQLPELQRGLLPDAGGLQRLPRRIPYNVATAMIWTCERMSAADAFRWGLVYRTVPQHDLNALAWDVARRVAKGAPLAQQALKEALRAVDGLPDTAGMALHADPDRDLEFYGRMLASQDRIEGQLAFLEKREPRWTGE